MEDCRRFRSEMRDFISQHRVLTTHECRVLLHVCSMAQLLHSPAV